MLSFMKKLNRKADKGTIKRFPNHTIAVVHPNYSVSYPSTFDARHEFSAVQSQSARISQYSSSSNGTALTDACTEPSVTAFEDLPPPAGPQKYHKVQSFILARPDILSTEAGQERHGKWCKTKKPIKCFLKSNKNEIVTDESRYIDGRDYEHAPWETETSLLVCTRRVRTPDQEPRRLWAFEDPESPSFRQEQGVLFSSPFAKFADDRFSASLHSTHESTVNGILDSPSIDRRPKNHASYTLYNTFVATDNLGLAEHEANKEAEAGVNAHIPTQQGTPEGKAVDSYNSDWRNSSPAVADLINRIQSISNYNERLQADDVEDEGYDSDSSTCILSPNVTIRSIHRRDAGSSFAGS
jgi:hypothetical protein